MRLLIWVPVIHNYADMGLTKEQAMADKHFREIDPAVERLWDVIGREIAKLNLDYRNVQIYMDSWFPCANPVRYVELFASKGSRNFELIARYIRQGAELMATENIFHFIIPKFLFRFVGMYSWGPYWFWDMKVKIILVLSSFYNQLNPLGTVSSNMKLRDQYVANRIDESLKDGKIGLLFMGAKHEVTDYITAQDIKVIMLPAVVLEAYRLRAEFNL